MPKDWRQARICVEKTLPRDEQRVKKIQSAAHSAQHMQKLQAAFITEKLWPTGSKLRIGFIYNQTGKSKAVHWTALNILESSGKPMDPLTNEVRKMSPEQAVRTVVRERIIPIVGLDIEFVDNVQDANIRVAFNDDGAWAYVGTDHLHYNYPAPTVNFGWLDVGTIIHEFGHVMGMIHEHQNPKGQTIQWDKAAVYQWAKETQGWTHQTTEQNILDRYSANQINGSGFDPLSIMLYFFPADLTMNDEGTEQNLRLSGYDVEWLNKLYKKNAPETAEEFYPDVYDMTLKTAIEDSNKARKRFTNGGVGVWTDFTGKLKGRNIWIGIAIILAILVVGGLIWALLKRKRRGGRYGR